MRIRFDDQNQIEESGLPKLPVRRARAPRLARPRGSPAPVAAACLALLVGTASSDAPASQFGRTGFSGNPDTNGGAVCTACHMPGAPLPNVALSGPIVVDAGSTHAFSLTVSGDPGQSVGANLSVSGFFGKLQSLDATLIAVDGELTHPSPRPLVGGEIVYRFSWKAPPYNGDYVLHAAVNCSDGALDLLGDGVATSRLTVRVTNGGEPPAPTISPPARIRLSLFAQGLERPTAIANAGDDRLFAVEQAGRIRVVRADGSVEPVPFLDIADRAESSGNEQGLLGLAFHPGYVGNGYFFVYYIHDPASGPDRTRVSRFEVSANPDRALSSSERVLLEFEQPQPNHNGGDIQFGPDGYLYIASGDGGGAGDPDDNAQDDLKLLGKLLRIDVDRDPVAGLGPDCSALPERRYAIPPGNAYTDGKGGLGCDEIYASGLRNPWRFSFDRETGDIWIADVGQNATEEIDFVAAGNGGGLDFGWRCREGDRSFDNRNCRGVYTPPVHVLGHADSYCSVTGGYVYRGFRNPGLYGHYLFSDFCNTALQSLNRRSGPLQQQTLAPAGMVTTPSTFGESSDGELFIASLTGGVIHKVEGNPEGRIVGEVRRLGLRQPDAATWHGVTTRRRYQNPVVIAGPPGDVGPAPVAVHVRNVRADGFEIQLGEWTYLDGKHPKEKLGMMVLEAGNHVLLDGTRLQSGTLSVNHRWRRVDFPQRFARPPVVLAQTTSLNGSTPVIERVRDVSESGFWVRLQEEERRSGGRRREELAWVAIQAGSGARHEAASTGPAVDHVGTSLRFQRGFNRLPLLFASVQTVVGFDPVVLRYADLTSEGAGIRVQEERSADPEVRHNRETVGYAVFLPGAIRARK